MITMARITRSGKDYQPLVVVIPQSEPSDPQPALTSPVPSSPLTPSLSPPPSTDSSLSDSDDSYAYIHLKSAYIHRNMVYTIASVEHPITKHCPIVTRGDLTPQILLLAENAFHEFFITKTVNKEDKVKLILGAFKDVHVRDWIATDRAHLLKLSFEDFMLELRSNFLPSDWM